MSWSEEEVAQLREMWDGQKLSSNEIGRRLGRSKSSVISAARRYGCEARPNPVKKAPPVSTDTRMAVQWTPLKIDPIEVETPVEPVYETLAAQVQLPPGRCQWIDGEPTGDDSGKCGRPVTYKAWCEKHRRMAYNDGPSRTKEEVQKLRGILE